MVVLMWPRNTGKAKLVMQARCKCVLQYLQPISDGSRDVALKARLIRTNDEDAVCKARKDMSLRSHMYCMLQLHETSNVCSAKGL